MKCLFRCAACITHASMLCRFASVMSVEAYNLTKQYRKPGSSGTLHMSRKYRRATSSGTRWPRSAGQQAHVSNLTCQLHVTQQQHQGARRDCKRQARSVADNSSSSSSRTQQYSASHPGPPSSSQPRLPSSPSPAASCCCCHHPRPAAQWQAGGCFVARARSKSKAIERKRCPAVVRLSSFTDRIRLMHCCNPMHTGVAVPDPPQPC